jgi:hypothetical protein
MGMTKSARAQPSAGAGAEPTRVVSLTKLMRCPVIHPDGGAVLAIAAVFLAGALRTPFRCGDPVDG